MNKTEKGKNMLNLGKELAKISKSLDQEKVNKVRQDQKKDVKKYKLLRSIFELDSNNKIKRNNLNNVTTILENDPIFKGAFKYNGFFQENEIVKNIPQLNIKCGYFEDSVIDMIAYYIEKQADYDHVLFSSQLIRSAVNVTCLNHSYNPVIDYLNNAFKKWDKKPRLKKIFTTYLGAEDSEVNHIIAIHFFSNAVAQVFEPGRKNDDALDLVGKQGTGKTEFIRHMAPLGLYTDSFVTFDKPDDLNQFRLSVFVNDDELAVSNKNSSADVKKFASKVLASFRPSYGHYLRTFKRCWSFVRTTNNLYYLRDLTGNRRFMPVLANKSNIKKSIFSMTDEEKEQLWGEAVYFYKKDITERKKDKQFKGILVFTPQQEEAILQTQLQFTGSSSIEDQIDMLINITSFVGQDFIKSSDLAHELNIDPVKDSKIMSSVNSIMINKMNFKKARENGIRGFKRVSS
ncbi:VapE domain-containing protein [Lactobacillus gallinarum]|uniref:VapE domain-containing protein n=1 Tax=Lactobacillus gallinarum TaxID=52242 RepID=UPI00242C22EB|nr:VapE domain-containing protein [Lactobacillus gallinarum]